MSGSLEQVIEGSDSGQGLFDAFELADGNAELFSNGGVGAYHPSNELGAAGALGGKRDSAARGQALHEHLPALAGPFDAANDAVLGGDDHVMALGRAVPEGNAQGIMATADNHAL